MKIFRTFPEILLKIELVMIAILSVWSSFFSAFDVMNGFSSYLFVQLTIIHSMIFRVKPIIHCMINLISYLIYTLLILMSHLSFIVTFAELINPFFMVVAACIMILLNIRIKCTSFLNQKLILEQNEKLELYANFDFLTNIPNRKSIIEYMDQIVLSDIKSIACLMIDIDNFKLYNDTYGHIKGDKCLCT
ncbi:MAG: diguanylate cyclase, partial [Clostridiales bacterium]|nr:diguanylate cyclase [Clostridiales bacterium]